MFTTHHQLRGEKLRLIWNAEGEPSPSRSLQFCVKNEERRFGHRMSNIGKQGRKKKKEIVHYPDMQNEDSTSSKIIQRLVQDSYTYRANYEDHLYKGHLVIHQRLIFWRTY